MRTSETLAKLADALAKAQSKMKPAPLNKVNPYFKSRYADLPAVREAVVPALTEHGLSVVQVPSIDEKGNFVLITRLLHASGEWIEGDFPLPMDPGKPQALGSALTYARRYSLSAITGIAADEDDDANEAEKQGQAAAKPDRRPRGTTEVADEPLDDSAEAVADLTGGIPPIFAKMQEKIAEAGAAGDFSKLAEMDVWLADGAGKRRFNDEQRKYLRALMTEHVERLQKDDVA